MHLPIFCRLSYIASHQHICILIHLMCMYAYACEGGGGGGGGVSFFKVTSNFCCSACFWNNFLICWNRVLLVTSFFFVVGDLNVHFDSPYDPCTNAVNVLGNLSLEQLANVPTHRRDHTLDWLITSCATDVLDLTVAGMLLSDHFVISFDLFRGNLAECQGQSCHAMSDLFTCVFLRHLCNVLDSATRSDAADPLSIYSICSQQLLDHHAPLVIRTVTDRASSPS